ncbi:MAG: xanthine dehydrogenase family protein subunit M [Alphaproteobacteria bacterium]|nr:xanthine dehydrogenase family protein subunit M [Alphaproteobacteria bacterium]
MTLANYAAPGTLEEATALLRQGSCTILAGGTDLMVQSKAGKVRFGDTLVNISRVAGLGGIAVEGATLRIGALATIAELRESDVVRDRLPALWRAADKFASGQIRNASTVGGNICNASPAGDTLPPLIAHGALVELATRPNGKVERRAMPLEGFITGPGKTRREAHDLVSAVLVPLPQADTIGLFEKFGTRPALDISTVSVAFVGRARKGTVSEARLVFGAVAPTPLRGAATEAAIIGKFLDEATIAKAADTAAQEVKPISDVRATAWYRREMIHNLTRSVLTDVARR